MTFTAPAVAVSISALALASACIQMLPSGAMVANLRVVWAAAEPAQRPKAQIAAMEWRQRRCMGAVLSP